MQRGEVQKGPEVIISLRRMWGENPGVFSFIFRNEHLNPHDVTVHRVGRTERKNLR